MNRLLSELATAPLYGQVSLHDVGTTDLPDWVTGEEQVVTSEHAVVVATRSDVDGDVTIRVFEGDEDIDGTLVYDGEVSVTTPALEVGSIVAAKLQKTKLSRIGFVRLRVFVDLAEAPSVVSVVLEPGVGTP